MARYLAFIHVSWFGGVQCSARWLLFHGIYLAIYMVDATWHVDDLFRIVQSPARSSMTHICYFYFNVIAAVTIHLEPYRLRSFEKYISLIWLYLKIVRWHLLYGFGYLIYFLLVELFMHWLNYVWSCSTLWYSKQYLAGCLFDEWRRCSSNRIRSFETSVYHSTSVWWWFTSISIGWFNWWWFMLYLTIWDSRGIFCLLIYWLE